MPDINSLSPRHEESLHTVETDVLVVGTGPAGGSLACFLAKHGVRGIAISSDTGSIITPRAHVFNQGSLECMRDLELEDAAKRVATPYTDVPIVNYCYNLVGEEYGRVLLTHQGSTKARYEAASPCRSMDLPQNLLEPILVGYASRTGLTCRFDTRFESFQKNEDGSVTSIVNDSATGIKYAIKSKYLCAADGGRSKIVKQLDLPLDKKPGGGFAMNVLVKADISKHMRHRPALLSFCVQPGSDRPNFSAAAIARMVRPWNEWLFVLLPFPGTSVEIEPSRESVLAIIQEAIGDDTIPIDIVDVSKWVINETVAEKYSENNIFALGDAVHRHPPHNGLGGNTSMQDAYNLAWKLAYVLQGKASPSLLDTYSVERQPVGAGVIKRCLEGYREDGAIFEALGMIQPTPEARLAANLELTQNTAEGKARRQRLKAAVQATTNIYQGIGIEMNQRYDSLAVYTEDETAPRPALPEDAVREHQISTYPGARLPHAWLNKAIPEQQISTQDLAGKCRFTLFTGIGGEKWKDAAAKASQKLGVEIKAFSIGWRCDYEDVFWDWEARREVDEDGCVLVRPDRFVAWRSMKLADDPEEKLEKVMKAILGR